jgi:hypothetical protein
MTPLEPDAARTLRAAADVFVPGSPDDPTPGASDVSAELFVEHYLDFMVPGLASGLPALLDGLAAERFGGARFADLTRGDREVVFDMLAQHEVEQLRDVPGLLGLLSIAAIYGEWTGQDADGRVVRTPVGWKLTGFDGPSRGRPELLGGAE